SGVRGRGARPPGTRARPRLPPGPRRGRPGTRHAIRGERDPVHHRLPGRPPRRALPADAVAQMTSIAVDLAASVSAAAPAPGRSAPATPPASPDAPAAPRPRLRGGAATREEAITAAITRFHRDGYDAVSMESIGADVGI